MLDSIKKNNYILTGIACVLFFIISMSCYPVQSEDIYMYLALGRKFFSTWQLPTIDPFIFSINNYHWTTLHQWFGYVIYYSAYLLGGFDAVIIFKTILISTIASIPLLLMDLKRKESLLIWMLSVFIAFNAITFRLMERTSLFSDLFIVLTLFIILSELQKPNKLKYFLPVIFLVWVNTHPVFPIGWALCLLFLICQIKKFKTKAYQQFLFMTVLSIIVCILNPTAIDGLLYPFNFATNEGAVYKQYYLEWMPTLGPLFRYRLHTLYMFCIIAITIYLLFKNYKRKPIYEALVTGFFLIYGFYAVRFIPTMCFSLILINVSLANHIKDFKFINALTKLTILLIFTISIKNILWGYDTISGKREFGLGVDRDFMPSGAVAYINVNHDKISHIFNTHLIGSYLAWMWDDQRKIFYHGFLTDTNFYLNEYLAFYSTPAWFDRQVAKYNIDCILLDKYSFNDIIFKTVSNHEKWRLAYRDSNSMVFLKK